MSSDSYAPLQQEHEGEIAGQMQQPPVHQEAHPPAANPYHQPQQMQQQPGQQLPPQHYYPAQGAHPALAQPFQGVAHNGAGQPMYPQLAPQYQHAPPMMVDAYGRPVAYQQQPGMPMAGGPQYVMAAPMGGIQQPVGVPGQSGHLPRGRFSDGIFDCFDGMTICLLSWCLLPVRYAQTVERLRWQSFGAALAMYGLPWLLWIVFDTIFQTDPRRWWWAIPAVLCNITCCIIGCLNRGKLRAHYQIPGSEAEDCLLHMCCRCCAMAQEARHVDRDYAIPI